MKVILLNVGEEARLVEIESGLKHSQEVVGGYIEYVPISFEDKPYYLVVNEEGKLIGLPHNRRLNFQNVVRDIMVGNGFLTHAEEGKDLTELDLEFINKHVNLTDMNFS